MSGLFHAELVVRAVICVLWLLGIDSAAHAATIQIRVTNADSKSLPCRVHLVDGAGKAQRPVGLPFWKDHFVCDGSVDIQVPAGEYTVEIERGPEYERFAKALVVKGQAVLRLNVNLNRIADLAAGGWYSGDLHVHRPVKDVELLMRAEDLHVAPVITWWKERNLWKGTELPAETLRRFDINRFYDVMAGEDEREGGALLYFHLPKPIDITGSSREYPSPMKFLAAARQHPDAWVDIEKPFWWDVPVWLASGKVDSLGLANNHMCRSRMYESEAWGRPRDTQRLPAPRGNGIWTQEIYYHILNCGIRIPPSAGSASGVLPNPVGYNRVYVKVDGQLTWKKWWAGLKAGRSFVTNGPLLRCRANGQHPGYVFTSNTGKTLNVEIDASLISNDTVPALEVIQNGKVVKAIEVEANTSSAKKLRTSISFEKSGWFLVRAVTNNKRTFRFASTAPWYVEVGESKSRVSHSSTRFFIDWVDERIDRVKLKLDEADMLDEVLKHHHQAREFWQELAEKANAK